MDKRTIVLIAALFALIIVGMFSYAYLKKAEINDASTNPSEEPTESELAYPEITRIDAKHYFVDGTHTFVGELIMPTPCDLVEVNSTVQESLPETIVLDFTVINNAEVCTQVLTSQRFMVTAKASEEANVRATFMGREVELNLIPAQPGESPDDFELFIKG